MASPFSSPILARSSWGLWQWPSTWLGGKIAASGVPAASFIMQMDDTLAVDQCFHIFRYAILFRRYTGLGCTFALEHFQGKAGVSQLAPLHIDYFKIGGLFASAFGFDRGA